MAYNGTVELAAGIKPKNNGNFPMVAAHDVYVDDSTRLDAKLDELEESAQSSASIAPTEASSTAASAHAIGEYFFLGGTLYEVTAAIAVGDTIAVGTNVKAVPQGVANDLAGDVSDLKSAFDNSMYIPTLVFANGYYDAPTGHHNTTSTAWKTADFTLNGLKKIHLTAKGSGNGNGLCFFDAAGEYISNEYVGYASGVNTYEITAPNNAVTVGISKKNDDTDFVFAIVDGAGEFAPEILKHGTDIETLKGKTTNLENANIFTPTLSFETGYYNADGTTGTSTSWNKTKISVAGYKKYHIIVEGSSSDAGIAYFNAEGNPLSSSGIAYEAGANDFTATIPETASYMGISKKASDTSFVFEFVDAARTALQNTVSMADIPARVTSLENSNKYSPELTFESGYYDYTDGSEQPSSGAWVRTKINVSGYVKFHVIAEGTSNNAGITFYDDTGAFIAGSGIDYETTNDLIRSIPATAAYMGISKRTTDTDFFFEFLDIAKTALNMAVASNRAMKQPVRLRVMTFNVGKYSYGDNWPDTESAGIPDAVYDNWIGNWKKFFADMKCDIIGMQEARLYIDQEGNHNADATIFNYLYKTKMNHNNNVSMKTIFDLYNAEEKEFVNGERLYDKAEISVGGKTVFIGNFHLTPGGEAADIALRASQWEEIETILAEYDYWIIFGDFNARSASEYENFTTPCHMANCGAYFGVLETSSVHNPTDNIITSPNIYIQNVEVMSDYYSLLTSDHKAVVADIVIT